MVEGIYSAVGEDVQSEPTDEYAWLTRTIFTAKNCGVQFQNRRFSRNKKHRESLDKNGGNGN